MADAELVVVHSFGTRPEADIAKSALDAAGIDSMIQADSGGGMRPHLAWAGVGFQILVREDDLVAAREVLDLPAKPMP
jgi:putative signal transducing protein